MSSGSNGDAVTDVATVGWDWKEGGGSESGILRPRRAFRSLKVRGIVIKVGGVNGDERRRQGDGGRRARICDRSPESRPGEIRPHAAKSQIIPTFLQLQNDHFDLIFSLKGSGIPEKFQVYL